jgi:tetratricopeptide (TPR) repeat protein
MEARERWQALQARLTAARAAVDAGDRERALDEITAALELDKDFLAAHALRDRIASMSPEIARTTEAQPSPELDQLPVGSSSASVKNAPATPAAAAPAAPGASVEGSAPILAKFEQRARRRRVDRRIDAARAAIAQQRLKAAAAALDEIIDLDPNVPELAELTAAFDSLRRASATPHRGPWIAAAAVFAAALLGGTWLQDSAPILSRQIVSAAPLPAALLPAALSPILLVTESRAPAPPEPVRVHEPEVDVAPVEPLPRLRDVPIVAPAVVEVRQPAPRLDNLLAPTSTTGVTEAAAVVSAAAPISPAAAPISAPVVPAVDVPDDNALVKQALQRYRRAYDGLDARSAQAVFPAVNEAALARAFDGLQSQSLTFDACDVRLRGEAATATCHGSARYIPKIGSREPRVEPRVWNFTLRKAEGDWKIDSARTER